MTSKDSSRVPWQFQWKRPQWQVVEDGNDGDQQQQETEVEGTCLGMASALVAADELPDYNKNSEDEDPMFILNVAVVSSPFCVEPHGSGDLLVLEIIRQPGPTLNNDEEDEAEEQKRDQKEDGVEAERLMTKVLRWPGVALQEELQEEEDEGEDTKNHTWRHNIPGWLGGLPKKRTSPGDTTVGVVAVCLCRRLVGESDKQKAAALDALDTMTFLSLGMIPEVQTAEAPPPEKESNNNSLREEAEDGLPESSTTPELLLVCLCSDGRIHVYSPWKLLQLSESPKQTDGRADAFANSMSSFLLGDYVFEQLQSNIWPLSQPEATVKLTVPLPKLGKPKREDADATSDKGADGAEEEDEGEGPGLSLWDRSVWDPQVDPFTAIYRTMDNVPTHCVSAFEYVAIAGRGKRVRDKHTNKSSSSSQGGFVTLLSLQHFSEVRTLFLPFVPITISPFVWGGMQFLFVIGEEGVAVAIRIDISVYNSVICGEAPSLATAMQDPNEPLIPTVSSEQSLLSYQSSMSSSRNPDRKKPKKTRCFVHRFQILPILLPQSISDETEALSVAKATLFGSSPFTSPPGVVMVSDNTQKQVLALQSKLESVDYVRTSSNSPTSRLFRGYRRTRTRKILAIATSQEPRHVARIRTSSFALKSDEQEEVKEELPLGRAYSNWCHLGQGWCLLGIADSVHFICWEGATSSGGPCARELKPFSQKHAILLHCDVLPVDPFGSEAVTSRNLVKNLALPFTQGDAVAKDSKLRRAMSGERKKQENNAARAVLEKAQGMDNVVAEAIQSISMADYKKSIIGSSPPSSWKRKVDHYSHREKSIRLLRKCPAWSQLDDTKQNRIRLEGQVPAVNVRLRNDIGSPRLLTMRRVFANPGVGTPFHEILSWLSQNGDYFTAASVALDLKKDAATLRHLWRSFERIDEDDERTKLEGLLDGILPIHEQMVQGGETEEQLLQTTLMQLADMTIGCLSRGGFAMSSTLEFFLQQDTYYEGSRTCLVLAAMAAQAVADDEGTLKSLMGTSYARPPDQEQFIQDILWPARCLLHVGLARKMLPTALALINAAVPGELRRKQQHKQVDSMMLCTALVKLIIGSSTEATGLLMDLVDEHDRKRFWCSLDHDTQLELALVLIDDECPLLQQQEVRAWALHYLQRCLHDAASNHGRGAEGVPPIWLKRLCSCCLINAACDISGLPSARDDSSMPDSSGDGLAQHVTEVAVTREALIAGPGSGRLDFNLVIPSLLLLEIYNEQWNEDTSISTQSFLNASCALAGRTSAEEPLFALDGTSLMKQCTLAGNICAGANLIGGKNGLILECCWVLIECCGISMEQAELYLRKDELKLSQFRRDSSSESEKVADDFVLGLGHQHVLWLLDQHILQVKTYGEFDSTPARGKVDPVFAARVCLRTWYILTKQQLSAASAWLASWLRQQLGMEDDTAISRKRLACAALTQVLLWPTGSDNASVLAEQMELESRFLVQISQACWSLVEAVPPSIADELLAQDAVDSPGKSRKRVSGGKASYIP